MAASRSAGCGRGPGLDIGVVGNPGVPGGDPANRSVQFLEQLVGDAGRDLRAVTEAAGVLVGHQHAARAAHALANRLPVVGGERAEVQDFHRNPVGGRLPGGEFGPVDERPEGDQRDVLTGPYRLRLPEGDHELGSGIRALVVGLAVEVLVLEEDDRVFAADRGAEQPRRVERGGGLHHPQSRKMGEEHFGGLAVVHGAAGQVAPGRDAQDERSAVVAVRAPAQTGEFAPDLHVGGPDVIQELDFGDRTQAAHRHAEAEPHDGGLGEGAVEDPLRSELALESIAHLEDAALALDLPQVRLAARVRHVLSEHDDPGVAGHLRAEGGVDQVHHRARFRVRFENRFGLEIGRTGIHLRAVQVVAGGVRMGPGQGERIGGRRRHLGLGPFLEAVEFFPRGRAGRGKSVAQARQRIAVLIRLAFRRRLVVPVLVRQRVGLQPDHAGVDERRPLARADVVERLLERAIGLLVVAAVALEDFQIGEAAGERRDRAARSLVFHRYRDGVAVVLDQEQDRQPAERGAVQRLPELALAGGAVAAAHQHDPVAVRGAGEPRDAVAAEVALRVRGADRVQELGSHTTRMDGQAERPLGEVRRHLPAARGRIGFGAPGSRELLESGQAQPGRQRAVPVVGIDPVGLRPEQGGGGRGDGLVAGRADLEERLVLPLQGDFPLIHLPGGEHHAVGGVQFLRTKRGNVFGFALDDGVAPVAARGLAGPLRGCGGIGGGDFFVRSSFPPVGPQGVSFRQIGLIELAGRR